MFGEEGISERASDEYEKVEGKDEQLGGVKCCGDDAGGDGDTLDALTSIVL